MIPTYARLLATACALATTANAVTPLVVKGTDFVNSETGDRFQILGVDYQPGGSSGFSTTEDPLSQPDACLRDAALMQSLGVNTIRVYNLSPTIDHSKCASIFNGAGIYMILDVNSPLSGGSLDRTDPSGTYNAEYFEQVFGVIEAFKNFPNTLAFFSGNEVINEDSVYEAPAYVRAVTRDMKDYISKNANRTIPVGYSAADVRDVLVDTLNYFECDLKNSTSSKADLFGLNSYSWCGDSSYTESGYNVLVEDFSNSSLPVFFSEFGCNEVTPRTFSEVPTIYGKDMSAVFSGGLVYEWTQEANNYGLVAINSSDVATLLVDYDNLKTQYSKLNMTSIESSNATQTSQEAVTCDASLISGSFLNSWDLPTRPTKVGDWISNGYTNATVGKLVTVSSTTIPQTIYSSSGGKLSSIKYTVLASDESNVPNNETSTTTSSNSSSTSSSTSSASSSSGTSSTKESGATAAAQMSASVLGLLSGVTLFAAFLL
ncbi:1,3-beta-glucanosyltransferase gel2 [Aspergillus saccharolyticus JOP 1030-1]|uniref:1,3-beta-glucanosyltransferase n=1 Tax=Aspergillus saccharolyticus JOP 1030-1 TaxID=1450539 RepID=A0A318ZNT6_9EURO|nr:1,3-beta-glucanosyltransferase Gel2 [Aspergillus saccharolyticus JOP 1030-1]PYH48315.1 1,3-beta-glucanosyltransferase Gel2 [Aspergillus saccharolyticus JOP 1030-1]